MATVDATSVQFGSAWANFIGGFLAIAVTFVVAAQTIIPYFMEIPDSSSATIGQQQTMFQTVFIMIVSFFFASTSGNRSKDAAIASQAATIAANAPTSTSTTTTTSNRLTEASIVPNPVVAVVETPSVTVPLHKDETATITASPEAPPKPVGS